MSLGTNRTTAEQDSAFIAILRAQWPHLGWWHQLSETWLIIDLSGKLNAGDIRDAAMKAFPGIYLMVTEAAGPFIRSGFARSSDFVWMTEQWDKTTSSHQTPRTQI